MPPKKQDKPKPLTKKEKRELALKLKEEEEQRRREEEEEKERIRQEEERKRREEERRLAAEEAKRLDEENLANEEWVQTLKKARQNVIQETKVQNDWQKYKFCSSSPDPDKDYQLTTFITQYDEMPQVKNLQIQEALEMMQVSENTVSDIMEMYMRAISEGRENDSKRYMEYVNKIREITLKKLEECTSDLTKNSEKLTDEKEEQIKKQQDEYGGGKGIKMDQKQQFEVYKIYENLEDFRYGMWINPNTKSGYRHKPIEFGDTQMAMEVPSRLMHSAFLMNATWTSFDHLSNQNVYNKYRVVGGVLDIECIERPPLQVKGGQWVLKYDYDVKDSVKKLNSTQEGQSSQVQYLQPIKVHYPLPQYLKIFPGQKHTVAVWDEATQLWNTDLVSDIEYTKENKLLIFKTQKVAPFAYLQERCTEYPYQKFFIRAVEDNKVMIDIMGARDTYKFEIGSGYALFKKNENHPELAHIWERKLPVGSLLFYLSKSGIHLMPSWEDAESATLTKKSEKTEDLAIQDICRSVRSFFIRSSAFSFQLNSEKVLCRIRENPEYDEQTFGEDQEKDWKSACWYPNKCAIIRARDKGDFCDERFLEDTVTHINLETTLQKHNLTHDWALKRMKETDFITMEDTLAQFLKLTHILTFTVFEQEKRPEEEQEQNNADDNQQENQNQQQDGDNGDQQNQEGENNQQQNQENPQGQEQKPEENQQQQKTGDGN